MTCKYLKVCFHKWIDVVQKNDYETVIVLVFLILTVGYWGDLMVVKILLISFMKRLKRMRLRLQPCLRPVLENKNSVIPLGSRIPSLVL